MHSQLTTLINILLTNIFSQFVLSRVLRTSHKYLLTNLSHNFCLADFLSVAPLHTFTTKQCNDVSQDLNLPIFCQHLFNTSPILFFQYLFNTFANTSVSSQYAGSRADNNQTAVYQLLWLSLSRGEIFWLGFACTYKTSSPAGRQLKLTKQPNNWRSAQMYTLPPSLNVTSRREGRQRKHL